MMPVNSFTGKELLAAFAATIFISGAIFYSLTILHQKTEQSFSVRQAQERRALDLFLSECRQPVEVCAKAYDDSRTLREIYFNKATK